MRASVCVCVCQKEGVGWRAPGVTKFNAAGNSLRFLSHHASGCRGEELRRNPSAGSEDATLINENAEFTLSCSSCYLGQDTRDSTCT